MRWTPLVCALILWGCAPEPPTESSPADQEPAQPLTVVFEGGMLYSGDDQPPVRADVGLREDRIAAIGDLGEVPAELRLDVTGLAVAPGFVDIHSHALRNNPDRSGIYRWPDAENLIRQGVTSIIGGPDGTSPLPIADDLAALEAAPASVNFGTFVGQGSIRERVVGSEDRRATAEELEAMRAEVAAAMRAGAFGLSTGLIYAPGSFASTEEIIGLARVVADYGGIYITHMRNEAGGVFDSIAETIRIGEEGGLPVQITHHKVIGGAMWGRSVDTLALVDAAIARGIDISIDQYPYTASSTDLTAVFPRWSLSGDAVARRARMDDPGERTRMRQAIMELLANERGGDDPPTDTVLADCSWDPDLNGLNLAQVLERRSRTVTLGNAAELVMELQYAGGCSVVYHTMSEDDVERIMLYPGTMVASDGGIMIPGEGVPHPRNYGAFARVLGEYARERGVLPLHTAIHKMTRLPAERIGLADRGRLAVGAVADIVAFDADAVVDRATFADPHRYAEGVHHVFVAGRAVLLDGRMTGERPGRVLRSTAASVGPVPVAAEGC